MYSPLDTVAFFARISSSSQVSPQNQISKADQLLSTPSSDNVKLPGGLKLLENQPSETHPHVYRDHDKTMNFEAYDPLLDHAAELTEEAHKNRLELEEELREGKGTDTAYARHIKNYQNFINTLHGVECHPITPSKVNLFLKYEIKRNKRDSKGQEKLGTSMGKVHIRQAISALQRYIRDHEHELAYANPITQVPLRSYQMVRVYEEHAKKGSHKRKLDAHTLKAQGTSSDTYTTTELTSMSLWCMRSFGPSDAQIQLGLRDRAMLLLSTNIAFRGDSTRQVLWSDLFGKMQPMPTISEKAELGALVIIADQAKTNSVGRVDEHALFRHREVELCGYGGMAFHYFGIFHILKKEIPDFAPDFEDPEHTEYGRRDWYGLHVFPGNGKDGSKDGMTSMTYENHRARVATIHACNGVSVSHVTHGGRFYSADKASNFGAPGLEIKALGNWKTGDAYSEIYMRALPTAAMLASAMFNAKKPDEYHLPRAILEPPSTLLSTLFPWVETEQEKYKARVEKYGKKADDPSLKHFLELLLEFRKIILQDAAILSIRYPEFPLWKYSPFDTEEFKVFALSSVAAIKLSEEEARHKLDSLPEVTANALRGILETQGIKQTQQFLAMQEWQARQEKATQDRLSFLEQLMSSSSRKRKRAYLDQDLAHQSSRLSTTITRQGQDLSPPVPITNPDVENFKLVDQQCLGALSPSSLATDLSAALQISDDSPWPDDLKDLRTNFILAKEQKLRDQQILSIHELIKKFGLEKIQKHQFDWISSYKASIPDGWLPYYKYSNNIKTIRDIWKEFTEGIDGQFSLRQLEEEWGARWRRNIDGMKTEAARRNVLIKIITALSQKPHWTVNLALDYLDHQYPIPSAANGQAHLRTPRAFISYLQNKKEGTRRREEVIENSIKYTR